MRPLVPPMIALLAGAACGTPEEGDSGDAPAECTWVFHADDDGDAHGDPDVSVTECTAPLGYTANGDDCDDTNAAIHPGASESCGGVDDDCDGAIDEDAVDASVWYADGDGDGFGDRGIATTACGQPADMSPTDDDCDDTDAAVNPAADETCNDADDDCDGLVDALDPDLAGGATWYEDDDDDGFGDPARDTYGCTQPSGTVSTAGDCNDAIAAIRPDGEEVCDGADNDCDGLVDDDDDDATGGWTYYADADGDGTGDPAAPLDACLQPAGYVYDDTDCDDTNADVGAARSYYRDTDGDGYGSGSGPPTCTPMAGWAPLDDDCDTSDASISPGATEICNGIDDDCDYDVDLDDADLVMDLWYDDDDGDGYGDETNTTRSCDDEVPGYVRIGGDCYDDDAGVYTGAAEYCDGVDNDCTGVVDDDVVYVDWYADADGDGYGLDDDSVSDCVAPSGYTLVPGDCDDTEASTSPGHVETCGNGADDNCDGIEDNCSIGPEDFLTSGIEDDCSAFGGAGQAMATPDLDDDGTADLILGMACSEDDRSGGSILFGPLSGVTTLEDAVELRNGVTGTELGASLAAGDTDGDGVDDAVLGSVDGGDGAYLFLGPITADRATADIVFDNGGAAQLLGWAIDLVPDVDGDGAKDLVIGAPGAACLGGTPSCGVVYVAPAGPGADVDLTADATYRFYATADDHLGEESTDVGDMNGDGVTDLALGSPRAGSRGLVYLIEGGDSAGIYSIYTVGSDTIGLSAGTNPLDDVVLVSADYDGDGTSDLFVGAPSTSDGAVYLFLGRVTGALDEGDAAVTWSHSSPGARLGSSVAIADVDGDAQVDVLMGAESADSRLGAAYLQLGTASGAVDVADLATFAAPDDAELFGGGAAFVPDWTGDGHPEVAIGDPEWGETGSETRGRVHGYFSETVF